MSRAWKNARANFDNSLLPREQSELPCLVALLAHEETVWIMQLTNGVDGGLIMS